MMKRMKRICSVLFVLLLLVVSFSAGTKVVRADDVPADIGDVSNEQSSWKDTNHVRILTREEFLNQLASLNHISIANAGALETRTEVTSEAEHPQVSTAIQANTGHYEYTDVYTRRNFGRAQYPQIVELGVPTQVFVDGSFRQFSAVYTASAYAQTVSSGIYTWSTMYAQATEPDVETVVLNGRGTLTATFDGGSIGLDTFLSSGFTITGQVGTTYYLRRICEFTTYTYRLYPGA